jgi:hypothetical protein
MITRAFYTKDFSNGTDLLQAALNYSLNHPAEIVNIFWNTGDWLALGAQVTKGDQIRYEDVPFKPVTPGDFEWFKQEFAIDMLEA